MQIVLLVVAIISIVVLQDFATGIFIIGLTVLNAVLGLNQEGKAAESVAALRKMLIMKAKARRNGELVELPAEELVPGDIITFEAGDKVSADGRLLTAAALDIEEAGLTGESAPVTKDTTPIAGDDVPLGDRLDMAYMNSTVTRGRGEMVVTGTGMNTEVGQISNMLNQIEEEKTPLTKQLDQLTVMITAAAGVALVLVVVLGWARSVVRFALPDGDQPGDRRDPDRHAGGGDDAALTRHAAARGERARSSSGCGRSRPSARPRRSAPTRPAR